MSVIDASSITASNSDFSWRCRRCFLTWCLSAVGSKLQGPAGPLVEAATYSPRQGHGQKRPTLWREAR
jgi:hypothetical protein